MRLFCDLDTQKFSENLGINQPLEVIRFKRSPLASIEVQFARGGHVVELSAGASGVFEVKLTDEYDTEPLTEALAWVKTGTGEDTVYTFTLVLINAALDARLGINSPVIFTTTFASDTINSNAHNLVAGVRIQVKSDGTLPGALPANTDLFVLASGLTANAFKVSLTNGGAPINITDDGTGTHSYTRIDNDQVDTTLMAAMRWIADGKSSETQTISFVLINDVCREGDVPPATPPLMYAIFLDGIATMAAFKAVPTASLILGYLVEILIVVGGQLSWLTYRLTSGPVVNAEPADVEPDDYNLVTNNRHWAGAVGPSGPAGRDSGLSYHWNTSTAFTDPTSGKLKVNNATPTSATELYISETDQDGNALATLLSTWDDGTSTIRGRLIISDPATPTNFLVLNITGTIADQGTWDKFLVTPVTSGGSLTNNLAVRVFFIPKGDKGDTGLTGTTLGIPYLWDTDVTGSAPASGKMKVNNGSLAAATTLRISETDAATNPIAAFLATWGSGTSIIKGRVYVTDPASATNFYIFDITAFVDSGTYDTITIVYVSHGGTFSNNLPVRLTFVAKGDAGDSLAYPSSAVIPSGTGVYIDWATLTTSVERTLATGTTTFTHINMVDGKVVILAIKQDTTPRAVVWASAATIKWMGTGGVAPTQSTGSGVVDNYTFWYNGTYIYGTWAPGA